MTLLRRPTALLLLGLLLPLSGCGDSEPQATAEPTATAAVAKAEDFPSAEGKTLGELQSSMAEGPILAPSVSVLEKGSNRFAFALFDRARKQVTGAQVALYASDTDGTSLRGPFVARSESLEVKPQFRSRQTASDPDGAKTVYVADLKLRRSRGEVAVLALVRLDGRLLTTNAYGAKVGLRNPPPEVGDQAPAVHTPTRADVGGDLSKISTRIEPIPAMHESDFADLVGKKPTVLVFATPQLCQSRICGPVVDVAYEVQSRVGDDVEFVHMEVFNDNDPSKGYRSQLGRYRLPSEPWTFLVDRTGRIADRFEGIYSVGELQSAVEKIR